MFRIKNIYLSIPLIIIGAVIIKFSANTTAVFGISIIYALCFFAIVAISIFRATKENIKFNIYPYLITFLLISFLVIRLLLR
jgi:hypothetical protein